MLRVLAACCLCLVAAPRTAVAEWHFTPMVGLTRPIKTNIVNATKDSHPNFGGGVTLLGAGVLGAEGLIVMTPGVFQTSVGDFIESSRTIAVMGNVVLTTPRRWTEYNLRPFVSGGLGLLHASQTDKTGAFSTHTNLTGINIGGGAIGFFSSSTGIRFDLRYYSSLQRSDQGPVAFGRPYLSYTTASVGVVIRR
jgi:hypothetical protein